MTSFRSRPRFKHETTITSEEFSERFKKALESEDEIVGQVVKDYIVLRIKPENRHVWSPQLSLDYEIGFDDIIRINGMYGPMPSIWSKYIFSYFIFGCSSLFSLIIGLSQVMLGQHSWVIYAFPVAAIGVLITYTMAQAGQKLGAEETFTLHHFYEKVMDKKVHIS